MPSHILPAWRGLRVEATFSFSLWAFALDQKADLSVSMAVLFVFVS